MSTTVVVFLEELFIPISNVNISKRCIVISENGIGERKEKYEKSEFLVNFLKQKSRKNSTSLLQQRFDPTLRNG